MRLVLSLLFFTASTLASYNIDDRNSSIHYSVGSIAWDHKDPGIPNNSADTSKCYDQTYTVNHFLCKDSDGCYLQIPFTGSGITIFAIQSPDAVSARITIDGKSTSVHSLDPLGTGVFQYNVLLYNVQSLAYTDHLLDIALVNYALTNGTSIGSLFRLDYASVNDTKSSVVIEPSPGTSSGPAASAPPSSSSTPSRSKPHSVIPIAVGGAVGGVAVVILVLATIYYCIKRRRTWDDEFDKEPVATSSAFNPYGVPPAMTYSQPVPAPSHVGSAFSSSSLPIPVYGGPQSTFSSSGASDTPLMASGNSGMASPHTSFTPSDRYMSDAPAVTPLSKAVETNSLRGSLANVPPPIPYPDSHIHPSTPTSVIQTQSAAGTSTSSSIPVTTSRSIDDQAELVHQLQSHNVPAAEIARLIANMRGGRESALLSPDTHSGLHHDAPPPTYDFKGGM